MFNAEYKRVPNALAENVYNNRHNGVWPFAGPDVGERRHVLREMPFREWDPIIRRWRQGPQILPNFKPKHYFTRPSDGKRNGWIGRMKDACTGEGADVFITTSGDKRTFMRDRPQRHQWTGWPMTRIEMRDLVRDKDFRGQDLDSVIDTKFAYNRAQRPRYDFRNREFESLNDVWRHRHSVWRAANWPEGARRDDQRPLNHRSVYGQWYSGVPDWTGFFPGGRRYR